MSIEEFWAKARPAVRAEVLQIAGIPREWVIPLSYQDWSEMRPLTVAMIERAWDNSAIGCHPVEGRS